MTTNAFAVLSAVAELGPQATTKAMMERTGLSECAVNNALRAIRELGLVAQTGSHKSRELRLTERGRRCVDGIEPMPPQTGLLHPSMPVMTYEGEAKERRCLMCQEAFLSLGIGHRVCGECKSSDTWRSTAAVRLVQQETA